MADYGPGDDPSHANYLSTNDVAIGGLIGLSAFAAIGIGAFFTAETLATGTVGTGYAVSDVTYIVTTQEVAEAWAAVDYAIANGVTIPAAATDVLTAASASAPAFLANSTLNSLGAMVALAAYNSDPAYGPGFFNPGPGGLYGVPHSFPGIGFLPAGPPGSYWACINLGGETQCQLYF